MVDALVVALSSTDVPLFDQTSAVVKRFYAALAAGEEYDDGAWARFMADHCGAGAGAGAARLDTDGDLDMSQPGASPGNICYKWGPASAVAMRGLARAAANAVSAPRPSAGARYTTRDIRVTWDCFTAVQNLPGECEHIRRAP